MLLYTNNQYFNWRYLLFSGLFSDPFNVINNGNN